MTRWALILLCVFLGVLAVGGGIYALGGAPGWSLDWLKGTPFSSYVIPGLILLIVVGGSGFLAAGALLARLPVGPTVAGASGVILVAWIAVEVFIIPFMWLQPAMFVWGLAMIALAWWLRRQTKLGPGPQG